MKHCCSGSIKIQGRKAFNFTIQQIKQLTKIKLANNIYIYHDYNKMLWFHFTCEFAWSLSSK